MKVISLVRLLMIWWSQQMLLWCLWELHWQLLLLAVHLEHLLATGVHSRKVGSIFTNYTLIKKYDNQEGNELFQEGLKKQIIRKKKKNGGEGGKKKREGESQREGGLLGGFFICLFCFCSATFQAKEKLELKIVRMKKIHTGNSRVKSVSEQGGSPDERLVPNTLLEVLFCILFQNFFWFSIKMDCTDFYHNHNFDRESHQICAFFFFFK